MPQMSISGQIVSEIVAQLSFIQTLLNFFGVDQRKFRRPDSGEPCEVQKEMKSRGELALVFTSHRSPQSERLRDQAKNRVSFSKTDPLLEDFSLDKRNQELLLKTCKKTSRQV